MNKKKFLILASVLILPTVWILWAHAHEGSHDAPAGNPVAAGVQPSEKMFCPVSGDEAKTKFSYEHEGKTYYFCCPDCIKDFKKDPAKYMAKMEKGETEEGHEAHTH